MNKQWWYVEFMGSDESIGLGFTINLAVFTYESKAVAVARAELSGPAAELVNTQCRGTRVTAMENEHAN